MIAGADAALLLHKGNDCLRTEPTRKKEAQKWRENQVFLGEIA